MAGRSQSLEHIRAVKARHERELMRKANVVGVGIGVPIRDGQPAGEPGIIVSVTQKVPAQELAEEDLVPQTLEDVRVWVEAIGHPKALEGESPIVETENEAKGGEDHGISNARKRP